jgi:Mg-chelatase subunit ChlD
MFRKEIITLGNDDSLVIKGPDGQEEPACVLGTQKQGTAYLLIDCSGSMAGEKMEQARSGADDFINQSIIKGYGVGLISFNSKASILVSRTCNYADFKCPLSCINANGTTDMTGALNLAFSVLADTTGTRSVVLVSDGSPDDPVSALSAARKLASIGVQLITIATQDADIAFLASIATARDLAVVVPQNQLQDGISSTVLALPLIQKE